MTHTKQKTAGDRVESGFLFAIIASALIALAAGLVWGGIVFFRSNPTAFLIVAALIWAFCALWLIGAVFADQLD